MPGIQSNGTRPMRMNGFYCRARRLKFLDARNESGHDGGK